MSNYLILKLIVAIGVLAPALFYMVKKQHIARSFAAGLSVCLCAAGFLSSSACELLLPAPTERVMLTALEEKNEQSDGYEVFLTGAEVDGEAIALQNAAEGKWFWQGDWYAWRPTYDNRQPAGVTASVVLKIPIGYERSLEFFTNPYKSMIEVSYREHVQKIDLYSPQDDFLSVSIASSEQRTIRLWKLGKLGVFGVLLALLTVGLCLLTKKIGALSQERRKRWWEKNWGKLAYGAIALVMLATMIFFSGRISLWVDEMHQLGWVRKGLSVSEMLYYNAVNADATPPFFTLLSAIWYRLVPYGVKWLLLLPEIAVALGIYVTGMTGERIKNRRVGIIAALLAASSSTLVVYAAWEYRSYAFFFLFSVCTLFFYLKTQMFESNKASKCCFVVFMILMLYTHYHAIPIIGTLFLFDNLILIRKKAKIQDYFKKSIPYFVAGGFFAPWMLVLARNYFLGNMVNEVNVGSITKGGIVELLNYWSSYNEIVKIVFAFGIALAVALFLLEGYHRASKKTQSTAIQLCGFVIILTVGVMYAISVITGNALFKTRYYVGVFPYFVLVGAYFIHYLAKHFDKETDMIKPAFLATVIGLVLLVSLPSAYQLPEQKSLIPYEEGAAFISAQSDYYSPQVAVAIDEADFDIIGQGWKYYLTHDGKKDERPITAWNKKDERATLGEYYKIYLFWRFYPSESVLQEFSDMGFEVISSDKNINVMLLQKLQ